MLIRTHKSILSSHLLHQLPYPLFTPRYPSSPVHLSPLTVLVLRLVLSLSHHAHTFTLSPSKSPSLSLFCTLSKVSPLSLNYLIFPPKPNIRSTLPPHHNRISVSSRYLIFPLHFPFHTSIFLYPQNQPLLFLPSFRFLLTSREFNLSYEGLSP